MSTIHLSQGSFTFVTRLAMTGHISAVRPFTNFLLSGALLTDIGAKSTGVLEIHSGSVPTFQTFLDASSRESDVLISFPLAGGWGTSGIDSGFVNNAKRVALGRQTGLTAATTSGQASWFVIYRNNLDPGSAAPAGSTPTDFGTVRAAMLGTVGVIGSGADLEIFDTNIVAGNSYTSNGFTINFPQSYTVA